MEAADDGVMGGARRQEQLLTLQGEGRCWLTLTGAGRARRHGEGFTGDLNATLEGLQCPGWIGLLRTASEKERCLIGWDSWGVSE